MHNDGVNGEKRITNWNEKKRLCRWVPLRGSQGPVFQLPPGGEGKGKPCASWVESVRQKNRSGGGRMKQGGGNTSPL